jgi:hypothetical protein
LPAKERHQHFRHKPLHVTGKPAIVGIACLQLGRIGEIGVADVGLRGADRALPLGGSVGGALASRSVAWRSAFRTLGSIPLRSICSIGALMALRTAPPAWRGVASASTPSLRSHFAKVFRQFWRSVRFGASRRPSGSVILKGTQLSYRTVKIRLQNVQA